MLTSKNSSQQSTQRKNIQNAIQHQSNKSVTNITNILKTASSFGPNDNSTWDFIQQKQIVLESEMRENERMFMGEVEQMRDKFET